jgi:hypothetical protein
MGNSTGPVNGELDKDLHGELLDGAVDGELVGDLHGEEPDGAMNGELVGDLHGKELDRISPGLVISRCEGGGGASRWWRTGQRRLREE